LGGRGRWISEFKVSLDYRVNSRTARAIQRKTKTRTKPKNNKTKTNKENAEQNDSEIKRQLKKLEQYAE
jgi:Sec-independent protein translocase protein TatA